jgi:membrane protein
MTKILDELYIHRAKDSPLPFTPWWKRIWRVLLDAGRGFIEDDCYAKASALTFYSLLSVVPLLAVLFGIAKGFGFEKALELDLNERFIEQKEVVEKLIQFAYSWLENVRGGVIAGVGTVVLLWSVLGLLNNIETALNAIWKTSVARPYSRKISDYLAALIICPIVFVISSSLTVYLSTQLTQTAHSNVLVEAVSPVLLFILKLFPFFLSWVLFTFMYLFMPNTKVYLRSALIAGVAAGTAFQIWQWIYIRFQIGVSSYGAIYGSFAALPLFLIWLQVSWLILLAGAEVAFEIENDLFVPSRRLVPLSNKAAALLMTYRCIEAFIKGEPPKTDRSLSHELGMSLNHIQAIVEALQRENILSAVSSKRKMIGYQPARHVEAITFMAVCQALDKSNELQASVQESPQLEKIQAYLQGTEQELERAPQNEPLYKALS